MRATALDLLENGTRNAQRLESSGSFDEFHPIGRNPFYKKQEDGSLRHETELIVDQGIEFIRNQPAGKPFARMWFNVMQRMSGGFSEALSIDGMYEEAEILPPRLNDPKIFQAQPDFCSD